MSKASKQIERYVRDKNRPYYAWRRRFTVEQLDNLCAECLFRFGELPEWKGYSQLSPSFSWHIDEVRRIKALHMEWKSNVRAWCIDIGLAGIPSEAAQFMKYHFAWHRYQHEVRYGKSNYKQMR